MLRPFLTLLRPSSFEQSAKFDFLFFNVVFFEGRTITKKTKKQSQISQICQRNWASGVSKTDSPRKMLPKSGVEIEIRPLGGSFRGHFPFLGRIPKLEAKVYVYVFFVSLT